MFICKATSDDFERIRAFDRQHKDAGSPYYYDAHWMTYLTCEGTTVYLAEQQGQIQGLVHISDAYEETLINHLFVAPPYRKQGVGKALMKEVLKYSDARDYETTLCVVESNKAAISLYAKFGFAAMGIPCFTGIIDMVRAPARAVSSPRFG